MTVTTILQAGTRVGYNATPISVAPTAMSAGANLPTGFVQITNLVSLDDIRTQEVNEFDDSSLEDAGPVMNAEYRPGWLTFTKKRNSVTAALRALAVSGAKVSIIVVYADGSCDYALSCRLINTSAGKGTKSDFQNKVPESYKCAADGAVGFVDHA